MATNKNAQLRYQVLDKCFSNTGRRFSISDLVEECNNAILEYSGEEDGIKKRQIYDDIKFMKSDQGWSAPIETIKDGRKAYYYYDDKSFSINKQPLTTTEIDQLENTLLMLNRFKGLPQFEWIEEVKTRFESSFKIKSKNIIAVSFEANPYLKGLGFFTDLFNAIVYKRVLLIDYKSLNKDCKEYIIHPYLLKQYNNRWFLFGLSVHKEDKRIMNLPIDRIVSFKEIDKDYIENTYMDQDYFDDVVGVSIRNGAELERIRLKIDRKRFSYIESKPIHSSQTIIKSLSGSDYIVIELNVIPNYELETILLSFADSLKVIEPESLRISLRLRAKKILENMS